MDKEKLENVKNEVQKIINNHLEEDQRFSIQDFDEESTYLLIDLLLKNNDQEKELIRTKIQNKIKSNKMDIELTYEQIMEINDKLNQLKNNYNDLIDLKNTFNADLELNKQLDDIQF